jgi:hypothetical protein
LTKELFDVIAGFSAPPEAQSTKSAKFADWKGEPMKTHTLTPELIHKMDAYWRAANYLSVGQLYLYDNPLLKEPLTLAHVKHMLLGHWGTTPGGRVVEMLAHCQMPMPSVQCLRTCRRFATGSGAQDNSGHSHTGMTSHLADCPNQRACLPIGCQRREAPLQVSRRGQCPMPSPAGGGAAVERRAS